MGDFGLILVTYYCSDYPEGEARVIDTNHIEKFYATPEDMTYIIGSGEDWFKRPKHKRLLKQGKLFKRWNEEMGLDIGCVKPDCHPVLIEVRYASDTHIYDGSTYIQYYFSDMPLDEFIKVHGDSKYVKDTWDKVKDDPIKKKRWEILDFS